MKKGQVVQYQTATKGSIPVKIVSIKDFAQPMPNNAHKIATVRSVESNHEFTTPLRYLTK